MKYSRMNKWSTQLLLLSQIFISDSFGIPITLLLQLAWTEKQTFCKDSLQQPLALYVYLTFRKDLFTFILHFFISFSLTL